MKKKRLLMILLCAALACFSLVACDETPSAGDFGMFTIEDVVLDVNETATPTPVFSSADGRGEVTFAFEGNNISIENGTITALVAGTTTTVTASTANYSVSFNVVVNAINRGTLTLANLTMIEGETAVLAPVFSLPAGESEITYTFTGDNIAIEEGVVTALTENSVTLVTATSAYHTVSFTVTIGRTDRGTLTIGNITIENVDDTANIAPQFSLPAGESEITYTFDGNDISIDEGVVTALVAGTTTTVTATTAYHTTTFTVTVAAVIDRGTLSIPNVTVGYNGTAEIQPEFSTVAGTSPITYTFDGNDISITGNTVRGLVAKTTTTVTATTAYHTTTFTVTVDADRGALVIDNITVEMGTTHEIVYEFTSTDGESAITYDFTGGHITIENGIITPVSAGTTTVTARTLYHSTNFIVTVVTAIYGDYTIENMSIYNNYPAYDINPVFERPARAEEITYSVDSQYASVLEFVGNTVKVVGTVDENTAITVTAITENFDTKTFTVTVSTFNGTNANGETLNLEASVTRLLGEWTSRSMSEGGTLFVGDSFFDTRWFWTNFYSESYVEKDAFTVGISSTTTTDWEILAHRLVYPLAPSAIVLHCGTNNIFDDNKNAATTTADIIRLFEQFHEKLPTAKIYYFGIEPRNYTHGGNAIAVTCNASVAEYCADKDWVVYLDSPAFCYSSPGVLDTTFYKAGDTVHPALASYALYTAALEAAGLVVEEHPSVAAIAEISTTVSQSVNASSRDVIYRGQNLITEFVLTGKVDITAINNNGHLQFAFSEATNRFLLWDSDSDKQIGLGWAMKGTYVKDISAEKYTFTEGNTLTIPFKLVVGAKIASFYFGNNGGGYTLEAVATNMTIGSGLKIGTEGMAARIYDMTALTKTNDPDEYAAAMAECVFLTPTAEGAYRNPVNNTAETVLLGRNNDDSNYTGVRDNVLTASDTRSFTTDFALTYDLKVVGHDLADISAPSELTTASNYFTFAGVSSSTTDVQTWDYYMFYIKDGTSAKVTNDKSWVDGAYLDGNAAGEVTTTLNIKAAVIRKGTKLYMAMYNTATGNWIVSSATFPAGHAHSVYIGAENLNAKISNLVFTQDATAVDAALTAIGKNQ